MARMKQLGVTIPRNPTSFVWGRDRSERLRRTSGREGGTSLVLFQSCQFCGEYRLLIAKLLGKIVVHFLDNLFNMVPFF